MTAIAVVDVFARARTLTSYSGELWRQDPDELAAYLEMVDNLKVRRYLEIGANNGDTFRAVMARTVPKGHGLVIDQPWSETAKENLERAVMAVNEDRAATLILKSSCDLRAVNYAASRAPFDLILIDGDHTYEGVRADWVNYGNLGRVIAFHDIAAPDGWLSGGKTVGVPQLWAELKQQFRTEEFVTPGSRMGFGILYR